MCVCSKTGTSQGIAESKAMCTIIVMDAARALPKRVFHLPGPPAMPEGHSDFY